MIIVLPMRFLHDYRPLTKHRTNTNGRKQNLFPISAGVTKLSFSLVNSYFDKVDYEQ